MLNPKDASLVFTGLQRDEYNVYGNAQDITGTLWEENMRGDKTGASVLFVTGSFEIVKKGSHQDLRLQEQADAKKQTLRSPSI